MWEKNVKKYLAGTFLLIYFVHLVQKFMIFAVIIIYFADIDWCKVLKMVHNYNYDYNVKAFGISMAAIATRFICFFFFCNTNYHDKYFNYDCNLKHLKLTWQSVNMLHQPKNDMAKLIFQ